MSTTTRRRAVLALIGVLGVLLGFGLTTEAPATAGKLVTGKQIKNGSVTTIDVRNGSVGSRDVRDGTITGEHYLLEDVSTGVKTAGPTGLVPGPDGPQGPPGAGGEMGPQGLPGINGLVHARSTSNVPPNLHGSVTADCPSGTKVVAGGAYANGPTAQVLMVTSAPLDGGTGWYTAFQNVSTANVSLHGWAVCARVG